MNNSYSTIPTVFANLDGDRVIVSWTDGAGRQQGPHIVPAPFQSVETMQSVVGEVISHTYLLGFEHGTGQPITEVTAPEAAWAQALDVYRTGYGDGMVEDRIAPEYGNAVLTELYQLGRYNRQQFGENGQRIEALIGQVREANESRESLAEQGRILLESRAARIAELEAEVGRLNRESTDERVTRLEAELVTARQETAAFGQRIDTLQTRTVEMHREFEQHAQALLDEADRRNWCAEYDTWVRGTNSNKSHFFFTERTQTWNAWFTVEVELPRDLERSINCIDGVYNQEVEQYAQINVSASFTCRPGEEQDEAETLRSSLYELDGVTDVILDNVEQDHDS